MYVTNPKFKPKAKYVSAYPNVDDIEYPVLGDIKMKPNPTEKPLAQYVPRIDRSSKPQFGQKSMEHQEPNNPVAIVQECEMFYDQILEKEHETLKIGEELKNIVNTPNTQNETEQTEWFNKQRELEYKLVQKENELNDTITGLHAIETPELETKLHVDNFNPEVKTIFARIEKKKNEHSENERRIRQTLQEVEEKRRAAREQEKRHLQVSKINKQSVFIKMVLLIRLKFVDS